MFGCFLTSFSSRLNFLSFGKYMLIFIVCGIITYVCGKYNGLVFLYKCSYGNNPLLCLCGGAGTGLVFIVSVLLSKLFDNIDISSVGGGTMVILGLHPIIIVILNNMYRISGVLLYVGAFLVLLMFIPINLLVKEYLPVLYGVYRITCA